MQRDVTWRPGNSPTTRSAASSLPRQRPTYVSASPRCTGCPLTRGSSPAAQRSAGAGLPVLAREVCTEPHLVRLALAARDRALADAAGRDAEPAARPNPDVGPLPATPSPA